MKKMLFFVAKVFAVLGIIWNTGILQPHEGSPAASGYSIQQYETAKKEVADYWEAALTTADSLEKVGGVYGPAEHFAFLQGGKELANKFPFALSGTSASLVLAQKFHVNLEAGKFSSEDIQKAAPLPTPSVPINWTEVFQTSWNWFVDWYLSSLPWAMLLFGVWFFQNPYFRRFVKKPTGAMLCILFWPVIILLVVRRKFCDDVYSMLVESLEHRARDRIGDWFKPPDLACFASCFPSVVRAVFFHFLNRILSGYRWTPDPIPWNVRQYWLQKPYIV